MTDLLLQHPVDTMSAIMVVTIIVAAILTAVFP